MTDPASETKWHGRPLRHLTDKEVAIALQERREAMAQASSKMAEELCQIAVDRLEAELEGRLARRA